MAVKIIKDNSKKRCTCYHCGSILEYSKTDVKSERYRNEIVEYITCPACGDGTELSKPAPQDIKELKMRDTTKEEQESINRYLESISVSTGINLYDILENYDRILESTKGIKN